MADSARQNNRLHSLWPLDSGSTTVCRIATRVVKALPHSVCVTFSFRVEHSAEIFILDVPQATILKPSECWTSAIFCDKHCFTGYVIVLYELSQNQNR